MSTQYSALAYSLIDDILDVLLAMPNPQSEDLARASWQARGAVENFERLYAKKAAFLMTQIADYLKAMSLYASFLGPRADCKAGLENLGVYLRAQWL